MAQVILMKATMPELLEVPIAMDTIQGAGGFGSMHPPK